MMKVSRNTASENISFNLLLFSNTNKKKQIELGTSKKF